MSLYSRDTRRAISTIKHKQEIISKNRSASQVLKIQISLN